MIKIRNAKLQDSKVISDFQVKMAKETENIELNNEVVLNGVTSVFENPEYGRYFIAEYNKQIAASLLITYEWSDWRNTQVWWIQSVYVKHEFRRKGIFKNMYNHISKIVKNSSNLAGIRLYVDKTNINARKVYKKIGMNGEHYHLFEDMKQE